MNSLHVQAEDGYLNASVYLRTVAGSMANLTGGRVANSLQISVQAARCLLCHIGKQSSDQLDRCASHQFAAKAYGPRTNAGRSAQYRLLGEFSNISRKAVHTLCPKFVLCHLRRENTR